MVRVREELRQRPVVLDRHGDFRAPGEVCLLPEMLGTLFHEDRYEAALNQRRPKANRGPLNQSEGDIAYTFVDESWGNIYRKELASIGVGTLDPYQCMALFKEGVPGSIDIADDEAVRSFLEVLMSLILLANSETGSAKYPKGPIRSRRTARKLISASRDQGFSGLHTPVGEFASSITIDMI